MTLASSSATAAPSWRQMLPREHGAWGLLLQPFLAGAITGGLPGRLWAPAVILLLAGFALRAPLLALARCAKQNRRGGPVLRMALPWTIAEAALLGLSLWWLWPHLSPGWRIGLLAGGPAFTAMTVWIAASNRQRSRLFQTLSAAALALSAPLAVQLARGSVPAWAWALWLVIVLHSSAAIQLVHERLERRIAARDKGAAAPDATPLLVAVAFQIAAGSALAFVDPLWLLPPALSSAFVLMECRRLQHPEVLREPLTRVGWRTLALSALHLYSCICAF